METKYYYPMDESTLTTLQTTYQTRHQELQQQIDQSNASLQPLLAEQLRVEGEHRAITSLLDEVRKNETATTEPVEGEVVEGQ